ncbi:hypothetical protein H7F10_05965 [Acidithiobacillus sp. HP-6]|uniref:hypothetical protein n=1 Tax=unclassified Acidithiobacillus TaxID=2614800 RepID=UPI0018793A87|nr:MULTISPECIES: hypothetical protein [unclassified Acidithiobacillus]MBE7562503.1 hypothetical protein [Acidithiobacillus sp. HP-6]MBE7568002.1 hypothetical protein [Acidithiobacillus sp. HP-2]
MNSKNTPSAWAKICAKNLIPASMAAFVMPLLAMAVNGIPGTAGHYISFLADMVAVGGILVFIVGIVGEMWAFFTGDKAKQASYDKAWRETKLSYVKAFRRFRLSGKMKRPDYLREMGAVGADLVAHAHKQQAAGRQSGHRKSGGHKKPASSSSDDSDGGEPPASLPLLCTVHDLAVLLQVSPKTLQNKPLSALPPAVFIPGCRGPRYHLRDVIAWLNSFPVGGAKSLRKSKGRIGRPRLATSAQIAAVRGKGV